MSEREVLRIPRCAEEGCGAPMRKAQTHEAINGEIHVWECPTCSATAEAVVLYRPRRSFGLQALEAKLPPTKRSGRPAYLFSDSLIGLFERRNLVHDEILGPILSSRVHGTQGGLIQHYANERPGPAWKPETPFPWRPSPIATVLIVAGGMIAILAIVGVSGSLATRGPWPLISGALSLAWFASVAILMWLHLRHPIRRYRDVRALGRRGKDSAK